MPSDADDPALDAAALGRIRRGLPDDEEPGVELFDPPAGLWDRIEESIARPPHPKEPPWRETPPGMVVEYSIDAGDVVRDVGPRWAEFARDNGAPELAVPAPDRTLWSYIDQEEIQDLWRLVIARVRRTQTGAQVPFRCDAPQARRWFDLTISPGADGAVHFWSVLRFEEPRPSVPLLEPIAGRDPNAPPVVLCSWCGRGEHDSSWLEIEDLVEAARLLERTTMPPLAHGICAACRRDMAAELLVPGGVRDAED